MRINGASFNSRTINGAPRAPVRAEGSAVSVMSASMIGTRRVCASSSPTISVIASMSPRATRRSGGSMVFSVTPDLKQTVIRGLSGDITLSLDASLYYSRAVYGEGTARISISLESLIGVVPISGQAIMFAPMAELSAARVTKISGDAVVNTDAGLSASAIRRAEAIAVPVEIDGDLDGSHITSDGTRYVGFSSRAPVVFKAEDGGMKRQSRLGDLELGILGYGVGRSIKPTLRGDAVISLSMQGDASAKRMGQGRAEVSLISALGGEVYTSGSGSAVLSVAASLFLSKHVFPKLDAVLMGFAAEGGLVRCVPIEGDASIEVVQSLSGSRIVTIQGAAELSLLEESEGYINIDAEDSDESAFYRAELSREFVKGSISREWFRG